MFIDQEFSQALNFLSEVSLKKRNLQMPGDGRYQPEKLKPYLGYDQWAGWLIIVEWFWMKVLAFIGEMPKRDAELLTEERLTRMLMSITTTKQDAVEKITKHDILALLELMRKYLPKRLHRWLHLCATSYDIICTAYALQIKTVFRKVFLPEILELDKLWREKIAENSAVLQLGRTHLQTALPITVGFWLSGLHNRFYKCGMKAFDLSEKVPIKFSGAVGTYASQRVLLKSMAGEGELARALGLPAAEVSTQITPPEGAARFYHELVLLSGALANLGEDARILQSSQFGEITSESSTSSAMSHKDSNPIAAENIAGMHVSVVAEFSKIMLTLVSDLQRDLRWSNVMRSQSAIMVYTFQQILTAKRLLKGLKIKKRGCEDNFEKHGRYVTAELLHLIFQKEGLPNAHELVNKQIIPRAKEASADLNFLLDYYSYSDFPSDPAASEQAIKIWKRVRESEPALMLGTPRKYIGDAIKISEREAKNKL